MELWQNSGTNVSFEPDYGFQETLIQDRKEHIALSGKMWTYTSRQYTRFSIPVQWLPQSSAIAVNSWSTFTSSYSLRFILDNTDTDTSHNVKIVNKDAPFANYQYPESQNKYSGNIILETI